LLAGPRIVTSLRGNELGGQAREDECEKDSEKYQYVDRTDSHFASTSLHDEKDLIGQHYTMLGLLFKGGHLVDTKTPPD
jgi:hypothetical protein